MFLHVLAVFSQPIHGGKSFESNFFPSHSDHMEEANKLIGAGKKFLVMGKAVEAVSALQEACGML